MQEVCDLLERLVGEGVLTQYAIGGATAAGFHGEPLATRDIDVFVFIDPLPGRLLVSLDPVFTRMTEMGFSEFEEEGVLVHGFPVRFLAASPGLESEAVEEALTFEWDGHRARIMRPEHLAALALVTGRPKDRARVVYLVELPDFNLEAFVGILSRHALMSRWQDWASALGLSPGC
jgi:hypothetical protein